ncbi:MAG: hypothetical protein ACK5GU_03300, partial [Chloroflexota bacterium]
MGVFRRLTKPLLIFVVTFVLSVAFIYGYEIQKYSLTINDNIPLEYETSDNHDEVQNIAKTRVSIGIYPLEVYDIDFQRNTYKMVAYVWMVWDRQHSLVVDEGLYPPSTFEIMNLVDSWDYKQTELINTTMSDDYQYYLMKIDGTFFQDFDVSQYPLDRQVLTITFEDVEWLDTEVIFIPDLEDTRLQDGISIPGWKINKIDYLSDTHIYDSKFGYIDDNKSYAYSQLSFRIYIERPIQFFVFKFVFPLFIIILFSLISLWMPINQFEVRIALSGSSLLNLVFLQQLYNDKIIATRQLVLMD